MHPDDLNEIVDDIIKDMPLEDWGIEALQEGLLRYILPVMNDDPDGVPKVMAELRERPQDTHRLRDVE